MFVIAKDTHVDSGSEIVNVGDEAELFAQLNHLIQETRVVETLIGVTVTWGGYQLK